MTSDFTLRDTPALEALARRRASLAHVDPVALAAAQDLLHGAKAILEAFRETFAGHGLSPGRYAVLMSLDVNRPSLAPSDIADRVGVTRATVTGLIDGLVRDGLVTHVVAAGDRRRKAIALTPKGEALVDQVVPDIFQQMADLTAPLAADERRTAVRLLGRIEDRLGGDRRRVTPRQETRA
jgi:DNA-binding MarR family transcriptional regulator